MKNVSEVGSGGGKVSLQHAVVRLKFKMETRRTQRFGTISVAADHQLLCEAWTEQIRQPLGTPTAVSIYATTHVYACQHFFALVRKKISTIISNGSTFLQRILAKKNAAAKTTFAQSATTSTEALLLFHGICHVCSCPPDLRLHPGPPQNMAGWTDAAMQVLKKA